jgi:isocitrate dehydrogenase
MEKHPITVAHGDGIGPEIMQATLDIILAAGAQLAIETIGSRYGARRCF